MNIQTKVGGSNWSIESIKKGSRLTIDGIRESILNDNFEISGLFWNNIWYVINVGPPIQPGNIGICPTNQGDNGEPIWHTHPKIVKYYLSFTDLMKPLKYYKINKSYVFTQHGYWLITPKINKEREYFKFSYENEEHKYFSDFKKIDQFFYDETGGYNDDESKRPYDSNLIELYIRELVDKLPVNISWTKFKRKVV